MKRERQQIYYLEQIPHTAKVMLQEDGGVTELEEVERDMTDHYPSRVPGRERSVTTRRKVLGEKATYHTLKEYASSLSKEHPRMLAFSDAGWTLEDIPSTVIMECNESIDQSPAITLEEIRQAARERSNVADYDETIRCKSCPTEPQYNCYTSGSSKSLYRYPMVEIDTGNGTLMQPLDVAAVVACYPEALQFVTEYSIQFQRLSAVKKLQLDLSRIPVLGGDNDGKIAASDKIQSVGLRVVTWSEMPSDQPKLTRKHASRSAEGFLNALQLSVAKQQATHERVDSTDYDTQYAELLRAVGRAGMVLTLEMQYMGMGESAWLFAGSHPNAEYRCIDWLADNPDMRLSLTRAHTTATSR